MAGDVTTAGKKPTRKKCPVCQTSPATDAHDPFCSARCQDSDLYQWLTGAYAIPAEEADLPDDDDEI